MSFIDAVMQCRVPDIHSEFWSFVFFVLNIIPGLGTFLGGIVKADADNILLGLIQLILILSLFIPIIGIFIFIIDWSVSLTWGFVMFQNAYNRKHSGQRTQNQ
ncbi:hypothetical protein J8273_1118 [Carpediemonas membranifera]|uniref:Uncharacterized protein n=1 Tax=Carpediemonas membranifera TaxID=201153 RepID=A0A8J6E258_9EUKA|nr:hypothetical protein J8273_1118 [Carpediemonas membranifera]|eukprot:KAG9397209.1 hypothetical protein J8273_1118 [Carpediemonas membranifera]